MRYLLQSNSGITALYCTDGEMTAGAFAALQDMGIDCPWHLSLVGFDDQDWTTFVRPRLTVVEQPSYQLGRTAFKELSASMLNPNERRRNRTLAGRLVIASPRPEAAWHETNIPSTMLTLATTSFSGVALKHTPS